jgi:SAM-dependent methyltransferase
MSTTDPRAFASQQFATSAPLEKALDMVVRFATDVPLVVNGLIVAIAPHATNGKFCEVGFGGGWLLQEFSQNFPSATVFGVDLSEDFAQQAHDLVPRACIVRGDMEALPFADQAFDCVASCCALYFARDIGAAIRELARVSRRRIVINTVGRDNLHELDAFSKRILDDTPLEDIASRFDMDCGAALLTNLFSNVERVDWKGEMRLPTSDHLVEYWSGFHHQDIARLGLAIVERARVIAKDFASDDGTVTLTRNSGAFIIDF